jgi:hypothetical protein
VLVLVLVLLLVLVLGLAACGLVGGDSAVGLGGLSGGDVDDACVVVRGAVMLVFGS